MIIVHVHHSYYPTVGGIENAIKKLAEEQAKLGHEVHVVTSAYGDSVKLGEEINGVHVHRVKAWRAHYPDLTMPKEIPTKLLKTADIVQGWSQNSLFTYIVVKKAKDLQRPIAMFFLGIKYLKRHYNPILRTLGYQYQNWITKKAVNLADLALVTNEVEAEMLQREYGKSAVVLPHGIDEQYIRLPNMADIFRKKYGVDGRVISYIGRIHPTKGLDLLIKAYTDIANEVADTTLIIAGKGSEKYLKRSLKLAAKVKERVRYLGYISEEDKIALIDASEFVVLPSRHAGESYPLLVYEAKARGRPAIVTDVGTLQYHVKNQLEGLVVPRDDKDALAKAIIKLLKDDHLRKTISLYLSKIRNEMITWDQVAERLVNSYMTII